MARIIALIFLLLATPAFAESSSMTCGNIKLVYNSEIHQVGVFVEEHIMTSLRIIREERLDKYGYVLVEVNDKSFAGAMAFPLNDKHNGGKPIIAGKGPNGQTINAECHANGRGL